MKNHDTYFPSQFLYNTKNRTIINCSRGRRQRKIISVFLQILWILSLWPISLCQQAIVLVNQSDCNKHNSPWICRVRYIDHARRQEFSYLYEQGSWHQAHLYQKPVSRYMMYVDMVDQRANQTVSKPVIINHARYQYDSIMQFSFNGAIVIEISNLKFIKFIFAMCRCTICFQIKTFWTI